MHHVFFVAMLLLCASSWIQASGATAGGVALTRQEQREASIAQQRAESIRSERERIMDTVSGAGGWDGWNEKLSLFNADIQKRGALAEESERAYLVGPKQSFFTLHLTRFAMAHALPVREGSGQDIRHTSAFKTIVSLHQQLAERNIDVIFVPIPQKRKLSGLLFSSVDTKGLRAFYSLKTSCRSDTPHRDKSFFA